MSSARLENPFADLPVIGKLPPEMAAAKLAEMGDTEAAPLLEAADAGTVRTFGLFDWWGGEPKPWQHTAHAFGYIAPAGPGEESLPIRHAGDIEPDMTLKGARVRITLNRLRVADYPGSGIHRVLFDFYARHQVPGDVEDVHFNTTFRIQEGEHAGTIGYPVFVGLNVGNTGLGFRGFTVNVKNDDDERLLQMLETDTFKAGLKLIETAQPAIAPLTGMAVALTRSLAARHRNVPVQDFYLGLDFSDDPAGARLAAGSYLIVQIPETTQVGWHWDQWIYHRPSGRVVNKQDGKSLIPYNYLTLGITRYEE